MKPIESYERGTNMEKNGGNVTHLQNDKVVLVQCNSINKKYQRNLWVLSIFTLTKSFGQLLNISPIRNILFRVSIHWSMVYRPKFSTTINRRRNKFNFGYWWQGFMRRYSIEHRDWLYVKSYGFLPFVKYAKKSEQ